MKTYLLALLGFVLLAVPATAQVGQLGFPSRPYGFDQSHPAAGSGGTRYSIISGPTIGSINLIKPSGLPNNSTAPTSATDGVVGKTLVSATSDIRYASTAIQDTNSTLMAIGYITSLAAGGSFIGGRQGGYFLGYKTSGALALFTNNTADAVSTIILAINTPYFLIASTNGTVANLVAVNLKTGQMFSNTQSGTYTALINGTLFQYANGQSAAFPLVGSVAAAAYTNAFLTLPQLQQIALDPWAFWYPRQK